MKVLVLGANGQLGREFKKFLEDKAEIFAFSHKELDILDFQGLVAKFREVMPDIVINCAAYTQVDQAEKNQDTAYLVNTIGAKNVSFASFQVGAKVIYFSTDYVFDGIKNSPYNEFDKPNPLSIYGKSKLFGEEFTKQFNPNHLVLRVSWLYGINGSNFVKTILKLATKGSELKVVNDQIGTPTYTLDVVKQSWRLIQEDSIGLYHSSDIGQTTWFDFAKDIIQEFGIDKKILPIKTNEFPVLAKRPNYSVLDNYLLTIENNNIMRSWKEAFEDFTNKYKNELINYE